MQLVTVPLPELRAMFGEILDDKLSRILSQANPEPPAPELITRKQVAELLGASLTTVDTWAREGRLHKHRNARAVRFRRSEVLAAFKARQTATSVPNR